MKGERTVVVASVVVASVMVVVLLTVMGFVLLLDPLP
jgi:hypothetical protein